MEEFDSSKWAGDEKENKKRLRSLLVQGAKITGGAVAGTIGFFAGGPVGAAALGAAGAMVSEALSHAGEDFSHRLLGPREKMRVGAVLMLSADRVRSKLDAGHKTRSDGFFDPDDTERSDAEEIAESIISKAQRETEEKKLPLLANMLANIAFEDTVNIAFAQQLVKTAEGLTYRQLCILAMIGQVDRSVLRNVDYRAVQNFSPALMQLLFEIYGLYQQGLIACGGNALLGPSDVVPARLNVQGLGAYLYNLMELSGLQDTDILPIVVELRVT
jgi:hypothetical protein